MPSTKFTPNTSAKDVLPAVSNFISRHGKEAITQAPEDLQEMFNDFMDTEFADDRQYRQRLLSVLLLIRDFGNTLEPFPQETIRLALKNH